MSFLCRGTQRESPSRVSVLISTVSLVAFVGAHPLAAWLYRPAAWALFTSPEFLAIAALLGAASTTMYLISKSIWPPVLLHWTAVLTWIALLGGQALLTVSDQGPS